MDRDTKLRELTELKSRVAQLESELIATAPREWPPTGYYTAYYAMTGAMLGILGAAVSLLCNVIGSYAIGGITGHEQHPLRLVQVYLTFPLGAEALEINSGITLTIGCCLYIATGMVYGVIFHMAQSWLTPSSGFWARFVLATLLSIALWLLNFYGILYWLQPLLFGGRWIVDEVPAWVAALTHLVFGWTMVILYPLGVFVPYRPLTSSK